MKNWYSKESDFCDLDRELNAFSKQGYEVFSIKEISYQKFRIIVYKEKDINKQEIIEILDDVLMGKYGSEGLNEACEHILKVILQ